MGASNIQNIVRQTQEAMIESFTDQLEAFLSGHQDKVETHSVLHCSTTTEPYADRFVFKQVVILVANDQFTVGMESDIPDLLERFPSVTLEYTIRTVPGYDRGAIRSNEVMH